MLIGTGEQEKLVFDQYTIRWKSIPEEASGVYQCIDSNDGTLSPGNTELKVLLKREQTNSPFLYILG